jgi:hypothetical protein
MADLVEKQKFLSFFAYFFVIAAKGMTLDWLAVGTTVVCVINPSRKICATKKATKVTRPESEEIQLSCIL